MTERHRGHLGAPQVVAEDPVRKFDPEFAQMTVGRRAMLYFSTSRPFLRAGMEEVGFPQAQSLMQFVN